MLIKEVNWEEAELISNGGLGVIYRVAPSIVAKVASFIGDEEIAAQFYFSTKNKALPVLSYSHGLTLSSRIHRDCCSVHGMREVTDEDCTCDETVDVLLMPEAETNLTYTEEIAAFMDDIEQACGDEINRTWDKRLRNVARHQGHLVALDFGDPDGPWR